MTQRALVLIANPASGRGRGRGLLAAAESALRAAGPVEVRVSTGPGDEVRLAGEAAATGVTSIAVLGGDGTWGNVAHGLMDATPGATAADRPRLVLLAAGTGNDFATSLGAPAGDFAAMVALAAAGTGRQVDVGLVNGRHFLNCLGFGFDAAVVERSRDVRWLRGHPVYVATAVALLFGYPGLQVAEGGGAMRRRLMYAFANGRRVGGGFPIAPRASVTDGVLDRVVVTDAGPLGRARILAKARAGQHEGEPEIVMDTGRAWRLRFEEPPLYQVDGELERATSPEVEVRCLPGALRVVAPAGAR
ncbi:MAG: hypothetical protein HYX65_10245 [Gemmatimonadetes bacterium]|nr:hypothetical protein [Gemmatimonadota bacterium]